MAERTATGGCTSLREMRERMVAAARAIAQERRSQNWFSMPPSQSSNTKPAFKPVIDGSVLKNDLKQKLAKERREEKRRQQDAAKEMQLLEKERKAKIQYEKQMEEKQRKLREQKQKDEQRRISAEEKRKQKLQEEREKFKAVVSRTLERSSRIERQKRWSWEGSMAVNSGSKMVNKQSESTEKLEQETCGSHKQKTVSSSSLQNSIAKKETRKEGCLPLNRRYSKLHSPTEAEQVEGKSVVQQLYTNLWENDLITRLITPTKASVARSKSAASLSVPGKDTSGVHNPVVQYANMPLLSLSSDELQNTALLGKSTVAIPPQEKEETPLKVSLEAPAEASVEAAPKGISEVAPEASVEVAPEASVEALPAVSVDTLPENVETSPAGSEDVSLVSVDPSPEVSMDSSSDVSFDSSPEVSMETSPEASMEVFHKASMATIPEESLEAVLEESIEVPTKASAEVCPESCREVIVETSSQVKVRDTPQKSNPNKKRPVSQVPFSKWSSSASGWHSPYPFSANREIQKNHPPSFPLVMSKQSAQPALSCKAIPVQHDLCVQNVLGTIRRKKGAVSKTTNSSEAVSQKHMSYEGSGNKSTQGIMSAEETTKILAAKQHVARKQREKEEKLQKEMEQRKGIDAAEKEIEGQGVFSKFDNGRQKKIRKKKRCQDQEKQKVPLQKRDAKIKSQEAEKRKKEQEKIMLRNLQERLQRKKRIEEIMKRTRKTTSNASKVAQTFSRDEEHEADDENESESDDTDFSDDVHSAACVNSSNSPVKFMTNFRTVKKTPRLLFLDGSSDKVRMNVETSLKSDKKNFRNKAQAKSIRQSTKRMTNQVTKSGKARETSNTMKPPRSLHSMSQECIRNQILDNTSETRPPMANTLPESQKHHLKGSTIFHQSPQIPLDDKNENISDSA